MAGESVSAVGYADDTPGVYKVLMVRMSLTDWRTCERKGLKVDCIEMCRNGQPWSAWFSKYVRAETPHCIIGAIKPAGSKQAPKSICTDRVIGTRKGNGHLACNRRI